VMFHVKHGRAAGSRGWGSDRFARGSRSQMFHVNRSHHEVAPRPRQGGSLSERQPVRALDLGRRALPYCFT
jgi:hypothetical protein